MVADEAPAAAAPADQRLVSKRAFRTMERNSATLFGLASKTKGTQVARLSLACNELLRQICIRSVEDETLKLVETYANEQMLKKEGAEALIHLAESILSIARSISGLEDTVIAQPLIPIKPPVDFGDDGEDSVENMVSFPSGSIDQKVLKMEETNGDVDTLNTSDNTESSGSDGHAEKEEKEKPVGAENDWCARMSYIPKFRPLTPEHKIKARRHYSPTPPPSPTLREIMKRREPVDDMDDDEDGSIFDRLTPEGEKQGMISCPMCDIRFHVHAHLDGHLVSYHRVKPLSDMAGHLAEMADEKEHPRLQQVQHTSVPRPVQHVQQSRVGGSAAIVSTKPLHSFQPVQQQQQKQQVQQYQRSSNGYSGGGATAQVKVTDAIRLSSTLITSPGGTIRQYSSPSNAARAAAKAAAAAAAGIQRPPVPSKPYTCRQCGVVLTSQQMYASHVRYNHPKEKIEGKDGMPVPIKHKPSSDRNKETAIIHLQLEDGSKAFQCRRCNKVFDSAQKVAGHSRHCLLVFEGKARPANQGPVPSEDRPYTVYRCGLNSELARTCPYCGELMPSIRKVDKHVRLVHEGQRHEVYGCTTCERRFVTLGGIENHWLHYGDCPHGVLTVFRDGVATCADIGEIPPPLKRPRLEMMKRASAAHAMQEEEEEDPSVSIVNAILGAHGFKVKKDDHDVPELSPELEGSEPNDEAGMDETAPELEEMEDYEGEGDGDELLNGDSHLDEEMEEEEGEDEEYEERPKMEKIIVSMKVLTCRHCNFASRTRDAMDMHMAEEHPDEVLGDASISPEQEEEEEQTSSVSPEIGMEEGGDEEMNGLISPQQNGTAIVETKQTGEMRRMLGMSSD